MIDDLAPKVEAVQTGQIYLTDPLSPSAQQLLQGTNLRVINLKSSSFQQIEMRTVFQPFNNAKVRAAVKLAQNRQTMLDTALHGLGELTADVPVPTSDPFYPKDLVPSQQDVAQAKALLSQGGFPNGTNLTLYTSDAAPNMEDIAVVFAQTVKGAGLNVKVQQAPSATYWDQIWLTKPFYTAWTGRRHAFEALSILLESGGAWNGVHFNDPQFDGLMNDAQGTTDVAKQRQYLGEAMHVASANSGFTLAAFSDGLYAAASNVMNFTPTYRWLNGRLTETWLA